MSFSRNGVRIRKSLSNDDFVKCLKRNLNATFTMYSFRKSRRQMKILIYWTWIIMVCNPKYNCIILPASHVIFLNFYMTFVLFCSSFFLFSQMLCCWSIFNYYYYYYYHFIALFFPPLVSLYYLIPTSYSVQ